jgi:putative DNA primase/helicase
MLTFTPEAKALWITYHDAVEAQLAGGGELFDVRDVASKTADNAARLAALFYVFQGCDGAISADAFNCASKVAAWHLNEARRFFGELAVPQHMADAASLERWLLDYCSREKTSCISRRVAQKSSTLRTGERLTAAINELADLDRARLIKEGKRLSIWLNPEILKEAGL